MIIDQDRNIAQKKIQRLMNLMAMLCNNPQDVDELSSRLNVCDRTIYRYIEMLRCTGVDVKEGPQGYYLKECPFCKRDV